VIERLAHDLRTAFPEMKGFLLRNLKYMRAFAEAWTNNEFALPAEQQTSLPSIERFGCELCNLAVKGESA
jgi:DUF1016 N-terminal domain